MDANRRFHEELLAERASREFFANLFRQRGANQQGDQRVKRDRRDGDPAQVLGVGEEHGDGDAGEERVGSAARRFSPLNAVSRALSPSSRAARKRSIVSAGRPSSAHSRWMSAGSAGIPK